MTAAEKGEPAEEPARGIHAAAERGAHSGDAGVPTRAEMRMLVGGGEEAQEAPGVREACDRVDDRH